MESHQHSEPVSKLLACGSVFGRSESIDYQTLGISEQDIPELIRMGADKELHWADSDGDEVWAPIHAWRALGQLRAVEALPMLFEQFALVDEGDDWAGEELAKAFGMIGEAAIPGLKRLLRDKQKTSYVRAVVTECLSRVGNKNPEIRETCITALESELARFDEDQMELNGFLVAALLDLHALESLATMEVAYQKGCVDLTICGDFEDVEIALGVREERSTPRPQLWDFTPPAGQAPAKKVGRNDPCPCGSGKKYKKCCLNT